MFDRTTPYCAPQAANFRYNPIKGLALTGSRLVSTEACHDR